ncbi:hypothetical protein Ancab_024424 [Ancistrocladus abbreviatus]
MTSNCIECSDALELIHTDDEGISVQSKCELREGDLVATIPKQACLTIKTSGAREMIKAAGLDGCLGLSVAVMYERSLGAVSPWAGYLQLLPHSECLPLVWTLDEVDALLLGTELHKTVKEDKALVYEDWKECILPLLDSSSLNPAFFGVEEYFAARSLVASRSFQIDDYHGIGMVPLADLFNHKTGAEDVHFTCAPSGGESEENADSTITNDGSCSDDEPQTEALRFQENGSATVVDRTSLYSTDLGCLKDVEENPMVLEMIIVKDVKAGVEVFNTYGLTGNAALLHRYGFTEPDNLYDIVNIDSDLVVQWSSSTFSGRHTRARIALWRKLGYSGCVSENSEYFEISFDGEPQIELLILLYIIVLPEEAYTEMDLSVSVAQKSDEYFIINMSKQGRASKCKISEMGNDMLLTKSVCGALLSLADMRESLYGAKSLDDDIEFLKSTCCIRERKLYHSLMLRVSERRILKRLRSYAGSRIPSPGVAKRAALRNKKIAASRKNLRQ